MTAVDFKVIFGGPYFVRLSKERALAEPVAWKIVELCRLGKSSGRWHSIIESDGWRCCAGAEPARMLADATIYPVLGFTLRQRGLALRRL